MIGDVLAGLGIAVVVVLVAAPIVRSVDQRARRRRDEGRR